MSNHNTRIVSLVSVFSFVVATGCAEAPAGSEPDAMVVPAPLDPNGVYAIKSTYSLAAPPPAAGPMLAELAAATDGPDDPARFLVDRMVAKIPDETVKIVAAAVAPYIAAYVQTKIDRIAPHLAGGIRRLGDGLGQIARRFATIEKLTIGSDGRARRHITGVQFFVGGEPAAITAVDVPFGPLGVAEIATASNFALAKDRLTLGEHSAELPYAAMLRAGIDRAVVPRVASGASSLEDALIALVSCEQLGTVVAEYTNIDAPTLFERGCEIGLVHLAAEIYERLAMAGNVTMTVAGAARVIDLDGDGPVDVIASGTWSGTVGGAPIAFSVFEGAAP